KSEFVGLAARVEMQPTMVQAGHAGRAHPEDARQRRPRELQVLRGPHHGLREDTRGIRDVVFAARLDGHEYLLSQERILLVHFQCKAAERAAAGMMNGWRPRHSTTPSGHPCGPAIGTLLWSPTMSPAIPPTMRRSL